MKTKNKRWNFWVNGVLSFLILGVATICFYPTTGNVSGTEENVLTHGDPEQKKISLMFNVYWGTDVVYDILGILNKYDTRCTFFIGGCWADDNVACLKEIVKNGHEIGNHGYFHKEHDHLSYEDNRNEISLCNDFITLATGITPTLFAPPSGAYSDETVKAASSLGCKTVLWSKDTIDWRDQDEKLIFERATAVRGGEYVLMHPMKATAAALEKILNYYNENGLNAVTVGENPCVSAT